MPDSRDRAQKRPREPSPPAANDPFAAPIEPSPAPEDTGPGAKKARPETTPHLEEWRIVPAKGDVYTAPEATPSILCGRVRGHPTLPDGDTIWTSPLVWIDCGAECSAKTRSRHYTLGALQEGYLNFLKERNDLMSTTLAYGPREAGDAAVRCFPNGPVARDD